MASILVMAPRVLIMDEPLVGLDYSGRRQLIRYLVELNRHQGITVIMVTHEIRPVYPYCSRIIQLSQGKMVRSIKPEQSTAIAGIDHTEEIELPCMLNYCTVCDRPTLPYRLLLALPRKQPPL